MNIPTNKNAIPMYLIFTPILLVIILMSVFVLPNMQHQENDISRLDMLTPEKAPQQELNASRVEDTTDTIDSNTEGGAVSLVYSDKVSIDISDKRVSLYFMNPARSNQDMVIQVIIQRNENEYITARSDLIPPGFLLQKLKLNSVLSEYLQEGIYSGIFNVVYYDPDTGKKASVNTNIPIEISVTK
ncbi:MAG: hypothetical protein A2Y17_10465 [Clostridiales bacterium GWF2_38_85]|nr:MAG: hypothetical protein A2Y17_10465 [Clostridiales bacterium GWF2_38_85]